MNLSTFQYIFSSIFKNIRRKEENGENEVTVNDISILLKMLEGSGVF